MTGLVFLSFFHFVHMAGILFNTSTSTSTSASRVSYFCYLRKIPVYLALEVFKRFSRSLPADEPYPSIRSIDTAISGLQSVNLA
ncbi:hypothetical protein FPQ18DRAFT_316679 [Pyronema domesticum]|nr:hypothetical protein FPQ18DRAFT_316679 [Pyronema domesticum]